MPLVFPPVLQLHLDARESNGRQKRHTETAPEDVLVDDDESIGSWIPARSIEFSRDGKILFSSEQVLCLRGISA